jgi:sugar phosphate isomerase/epimerase
MKLSIVLSTHAAQFQAVAFKGDFQENVAKIAKWGYEGVEIAIRDPSLVDVDELIQVVSAYDLIVPAIGTGQAWGEEKLSLTSRDPAVRTQAIERIKSHVPLASRLNAMIILGLIRGITPADASKEESMALLLEGLSECSRFAAEAGVRMAIEPLNRYETDLIHTMAEGIDLIAKVGADNLGLLLDTFHMNIEEPVIEESIRDCGDRIFHFHVADSNRLHAGGGHLDFDSILRALFSTGYQGFVSGEFMPLPDADMAARLNIEWLRKIEAGLRSDNRAPRQVTEKD